VALTLDVDFGLERLVCRLALSGELLDLLFVVLQLGDHLLGLAHLGFEGGGFLFRASTDLFDLREV